MYRDYGHPVEIVNITDNKLFSKEPYIVYEYAEFVFAHTQILLVFSYPGVLSCIPQDENM